MNLQLPNVKAALFEAAGGISRIWYGWFRGVQQHVDDKANPHGTTAAQVGADASGTAAAAVVAHAALATNVHGVGASTVASAAQVASAVSAHEAVAAPHSGHEVTSAKAAANGYASLNASSKVVQDPGNAQAAAAAAKIPISGAGGTVDAGWIPSLSYLPSSGGTVSGSVTLSGSVSMSVGSGTYVDGLSASLGGMGSGDRQTAINFSGHGDAWDAIGYADGQIVRYAGANGNWAFRYRGTGYLIMNAVDAGGFLVKTSNTDRFYVDSAGAPVFYSDSVRLANSKTPATAGATGTTGQIAWDSNYIYVCVSTNTWKRSALSTW